jgi:hypothetical protein
MSKEETTGKEFYESADKVITVTRQETLEEAAKRTYQKGLKDDLSLSFHDGVKFGAKWQEERMYSEEEVFNLCRDFAIFIQQKRPSYKKQLEWFEQFKKK